MNKEKLKDCPFCGGKAEKSEKYKGNYIVRCSNVDCFANIGDWVLDHEGHGYQDINEAINEWNKRDTKLTEELTWPAK